MTAKPGQKPRTVHFISLGCAKNRIDTEAMLGLLARCGYHQVADPAEAEVVVVNTCGFIKAAVKESLAELRRLARDKSRFHYRLIAAGCLVQRWGKEMAGLIPELDSLIGVHGCRLVSRAVSRRGIYIPPRPSRYKAGYYRNRQLTTGPGWAYLRIADGCDNGCSYCLIPRIRGSYRSRRMEDILAEAELLAAQGVKEINLIAQDTTYYGVDIYGRRSLGRLLKKLDRVAGIEWIRLLYTHPAHFDDDLIQELGSVRHLVRYLDIPLQHISDRILGSMGRRTKRRRIEALVEKLRRSLPGLVLRTTLMVGYPGETEEEFAELLAYVKQTGFERLGVFVYSPEPGTRASALAGQVPPKQRLRRWHRLMQEQRKISLERQRRCLGKEILVLVEGDPMGSSFRPTGGYGYFGRSEGEAPEVDGRVYLRSQVALYPGQMVKALVVAAGEYDLYGRVTEVAD